MAKLLFVLMKSFEKNMQIIRLSQKEVLLLQAIY